MGGDSQGEIERGAGVATLLALRATSPYAGGFGDGGTDCHGQCAHWPRNDIVFSWGCGVRRGTWAPPYKGLCNIAGGQGHPPLRKARRCEQARTGGVEPRPYGSATRGAMGGRPQGSPLRKRCKECDFYRVGRCGERIERCQWQEKRDERVAAVKISSVRRKAA